MVLGQKKEIWRVRITGRMRVYFLLWLFLIWFLKLPNWAQAAEFEALGDLAVPGGNIGIGRTSPTSRLHIVASGADTGINLRIQNSSAADTVTFLDNGNIGIGITLPTSKLHVVGNITANTGTFTTLQNASYTLPAGTGTDDQILKWDGATLGWEEDAGGAGGGTASLEGTVTGLMYLKAANTGAGMSLVVTDGANISLGVGTADTLSTLYIQGNTGTTFPLRIATSAPADALVVMQDGNVGIGVTGPAAKLEIIGSATSDIYALKVYSGSDLVAWARKK